jgi:hypothetical protein
MLHRTTENIPRHPIYALTVSVVVAAAAAAAAAAAGSVTSGPRQLSKVQQCSELMRQLFDNRRQPTIFGPVFSSYLASINL